MAKETSERSSSHRDPSEGGWDTSIVKAPDSHKGGKRRRKHRHHRTKRWQRVLIGVAAAVVVLAGVAFGVGRWYIGSLDRVMSLGEDTENVQAALTDVPVGQPFYVLLLGSDMRQGLAAQASGQGAAAAAMAEANYAKEASTQGDGSRSDVIMLLRVDPGTSRLTMFTVPRDTPYTFPDGTIYKINHAYEVGGAAGIIGAVQDVTGVQIAHYAEVHGGDLENLVDSLGGISVNVPMAYDYTTITGEHVHLDEGLQRVNGAEALAFANMRVLYSGNQDSKRQSAARQVVSGIIDAIRTRPIAQIPGAIADAAACVRTDMEVDEIIDLFRQMGNELILYSGTGPIAGDLDPYVVYEAGTSREWTPWLCYVNDAGWQRVLELLKAGEDPSHVNYEKDKVHHAGQPEDTWHLGPVGPDDLPDDEEDSEEGEYTEGENEAEDELGPEENAEPAPEEVVE